MVQKMAGPSGRSASSLSDEVGVPQVTLSRWLKQATVPAVSKKKTTTKKKRRRSRAGSTAKRPQRWTPQDKLQVILEAAALSDDELGEFLRRRGLHEAQLTEWREQLLKAAPDVFATRRRKQVSPETKRIRELEKDLRRKEKALAETSALLVLKKKADAIWGVVDDDTSTEND